MTWRNVGALGVAYVVGLQCLLGHQAGPDTPSSDGVFRYDIDDLTTGKPSVSDAKSIQYGRYRAYFGHGPAALYHEAEPHKPVRVMHTSRSLVGKAMDLSPQYEERWVGQDKLVITHFDLEGERKGHKVQRTLTRVSNKRSPLDGAWSVEVRDLTAASTLAGDRVIVRYGDHLGFFVQEADARLYAVHAVEESPRKYQVLFSTNAEEIKGTLDISKEYEGRWVGQQWVESYTSAGDSFGPAGHRMQRTHTRMPR